MHRLDDCFVAFQESPEASLGFKERLLLKWIADRGFVLKHKLYGFWCGRAGAKEYQDILVYEKPPTWAGKYRRGLSFLFQSRLSRSVKDHLVLPLCSRAQTVPRDTCFPD